MGMAGSRQILCRAAKFHQDRHFVDDLTRIHPDDMRAKHAIGLGIGQDLHESVRRLVRLGPAIRQERELADLVFDAGSLQLFFRLADGSDFRARIKELLVLRRIFRLCRFDHSIPLGSRSSPRFLIAT